MSESVLAQVKALQGMPVSRLREKWRDVFGTKPPNRSQGYLWRRLAWKIQEDHYGKMSPEDRARVSEMRVEIDAGPLTVWSKQKRARTATKTPQKPTHDRRDPRLPISGTVISRWYKGAELTVKVLDKGFEFEGRVYRSLSAIAREVTGTSWNGYSFWRLSEGARR